MAISYSHKFGQMIGDLVEGAVEITLKKFASDHALFFDKKGIRPTRTGKKLTWTDKYGNKHDLDIVLEKGGTDKKLGTPAAFIELAWRSYTKHSRNKVQEIQGAVLPLIERYKDYHPFKGAILAGNFTEPSIQQLKSLGFCVLYLPHKTVVAAFKKFGVDSSFDEETSEADFMAKIKGLEGLSTTQRAGVAAEIIRINEDIVNNFLESLKTSITRQINSVFVIALHGNETKLLSVEDAIIFLNDYSEDIGSLPVFKYEILIRYNNGDDIKATFQERADAIKFLSGYK